MLEKKKWNKIYFLVMFFVSLILGAGKILKFKLAAHLAEKEVFEPLLYAQITDISRIIGIVQTVFFYIFILYLLNVAFGKHKIKIENFLVQHVLFVAIATGTNLLMGAFFAIPIGNRLEQFFDIYKFIAVIAIYYLAKLLIGKIMKFFSFLLDSKKQELSIKKESI